MRACRTFNGTLALLSKGHTNRIMSLTSLFDELDVVKDSSHCSELIVAYLVLVIVSVSLITTLLTEFKNSLYDPADLCYLICIVYHNKNQRQIFFPVG